MPELFKITPQEFKSKITDIRLRLKNGQKWGFKTF